MNIKKVLLLLLACVLSIFFVEFLLRFINYPYVGRNKILKVSESSMGQFDPELGWSYKRHYTLIDENKIIYSFNDEGYRTDNVDSKTDFTKPIILIVGSSILFGDSINFVDTFGYKLQNKLNDKYLVINMAVQAYGLDQVYLRLKQIMDIYKPKYVILDFIDDYYNRDVNRDRRALFLGTRLNGTKPVFSIKENALYLRHKPEKFTSFDSPRVRLVIRRLIDVMNQKNVNKFMLTKLLYLEIEKYVNDNGSRLLTINYWADVKDYQLGRDGLGVAFFPKKEGLYLPFPDEFHPNKEGTSAMVEIFLKTYSDLFINNTLLQKSM